MKRLKLSGKVMVHLDSGTTIVGVVVRVRRRELWLADARVSVGGGEAEPAKGLQWVPRERVQFVQVGA